MTSNPDSGTLTEAEVRVLRSENRSLRKLATDALNALVDVPLSSLIDRLPDAARARADYFRLTAPQPPNGERVAEAREALLLCVAQMISAPPKIAYEAGADSDTRIDALIAAVRAEGRREAVREVREKVEKMGGLTAFATYEGTVDFQPEASFPTWLVRRADVLAALDAMEKQP